MTQSGWLIEPSGINLPNLRLRHTGTGGQVVPAFQVEFSSYQGFALYYVEAFDGFVSANWDVSVPRVPRTWIIVLPNPEECQTRGGAENAWLFEVVGTNKTQVSFNVRDDDFFAYVVLVAGDFVVNHQAL